MTAIKTTLRDLSTSYASHSERIASEVAELQSQRRAAAALLDDLKQAVGSCVRRAELEDRLVEERLREGETVRKAMQTAEEVRTRGWSASDWDGPGRCFCFPMVVVAHSLFFVLHG